MPASPSPPPVVRVSHLTKRFGAQVVVDDLSFEVAAGETLVLLGPSGCGKTTLLKLLNRLIEPDDGTVEINGRDVRRQQPEELRRGIGYVIQQVGLLPHYTVAENIAVVPRLLGRPVAETAARTAELLDRLHLPAARFGPLLPAQLSGGQQQRVGLARALAADPPIVLMDEPFGALDPITRAAVRRDFRELDELRRKTVVLVTHDVQEAFELADRILLLNHGKIQQLGPPRELLLRPANAFVRSFFAAEQLALQLRVLTLADVLPALAGPAPAPTAPPGQALLSPDTPLHDALALLTGSATPNTSPPAPNRAVPAVPAPLLVAGDLTPGVHDLVPAVLEVEESGNEVVNAGNDFVEGGNEVEDGGNDLADAVLDLEESGNDLAPGVNEGEDGVNEGGNGVNDLVPAGSKVVPGVNDLAPGGNAAVPRLGLWVALPDGTARPLTLPQLLGALGELLQTTAHP